MTKIKGFTLIEVVIATTILIVVLTVITTSLMSQNEIIQVSQARQARDSAYLEALNVIGRDTRIAVEAPATYAAPNSIQYTADSNTLILKTYMLSATGEAYCDFYDYIVYQREGSTLKQITYPAQGSARPTLNKELIGNVTNVTFSKTVGQSAGAHMIITTTVQTTQTVGAQTLTKDYSQTVASRNN